MTYALQQKEKKTLQIKITEPKEQFWSHTVFEHLNKFYATIMPEGEDAVVCLNSQYISLRSHVNMWYTHVDTVSEAERSIGWDLLMFINLSSNQYQK